MGGKPCYHGYRKIIRSSWLPMYGDSPAPKAHFRVKVMEMSEIKLEIKLKR